MHKRLGKPADKSLFPARCVGGLKEVKLERGIERMENERKVCNACNSNGEYISLIDLLVYRFTVSVEWKYT
jgi:hypothetical protein